MLAARFGRMTLSSKERRDTTEPITLRHRVPSGACFLNRTHGGVQDEVGNGLSLHLCGGGDSLLILNVNANLNHRFFGQRLTPAIVITLAFFARLSATVNTLVGFYARRCSQKSSNQVLKNNEGFGCRFGRLRGDGPLVALAPLTSSLGRLECN